MRNAISLAAENMLRAFAFKSPGEAVQCNCVKGTLVPEGSREVAYMSSLPKNGEHSIEEILASIRRQAARQPFAPTGAGRASSHNYDYGGGGQQSAQAAQAAQSVYMGPAPQSVPANPVHGMRHEHAVQPEVTNSDVRGSVANDDDLPTVIKRAFHPEPAGVNGLRRLATTRLGDALRFVGNPAGMFDARSERGAAPAQQHEAPVATPNPIASPSDEPEVKREMVSFMDTRFKSMSMSSTPAPAAQPSSEQPTAHSSAPAGEGAGLVGLLSQVGGDGQAGMAQLLRPMLKEWLSENMPRIVEKALHMELAEKAGGTRRNGKG